MEGRSEGYQKNDMANEVIIELIARTQAAEGKIKDLEGKIKETKKTTEEATAATKGMTNQLDRMTGGAVTAFRGIVNGAKSGVMAMTTLKRMTGEIIGTVMFQTFCHQAAPSISAASYS